MNKQAKIKKVMEEFKNGTLKTPDGKVVKNRKQALAIAMSESEDYAEKSLISQINIGSVSEAEDIIKAAGSEELFEKAQPGDEREYQGRIYVYGTTKSGKMGWKVKEKAKRAQGTPTSSAGGSSTTQKKTTAESRKIYNTILGINNTGTTVRETSDAFEVKFDPNDFKTHGKVSQAVSQIVRYYRQTNSVDIDEKNNKIVIRKKQTKSSNSVVHDINGTKVTVTKNSDGSYTLEANGKKVKSDDPSFFVYGTNIKPRVKNALAKEVGLDTAATKKKLRPIGTGTLGPERRRKSTKTSKVPKGNRISAEDDIVEVYDDKGKKVYSGILDYCPYKDDNFKWNEKDGNYDLPKGYKMVGK